MSALLDWLSLASLRTLPPFTLIQMNRFYLRANVRGLCARILAVRRRAVTFARALISSGFWASRPPPAGSKTKVRIKGEKNIMGVDTIAMSDSGVHALRQRTGGEEAVLFYSSTDISNGGYLPSGNAPADEKRSEFAHRRTSQSQTADIVASWKTLGNTVNDQRQRTKLRKDSCS
ncbi:hypothetical protein C8R44DRAFT_754102 [Mycena epipterygia]|nr:hypothetical protein C8R44DRAFT_754102 [Mycena epipterygia]